MTISSSTATQPIWQQNGGWTCIATENSFKYVL